MVHFINLKVNVYLAKFTKNNKTCYKIGHTKYNNILRDRFGDIQYNIFDNIEILSELYISHDSARVARLVTEAIEVTLKAVWPKNFNLEQHFGCEPGTFDGLSGITEMFIGSSPKTELILVETFKRVSLNVSRLEIHKVQI